MSCLAHPRKHRLLCRPEFVACYDRGRRYFSRRFIAFVLPRENSELPSRCGAGVGRKTGNAVRRNRVKRLIREFFRCHKAQFGPGLDVVVVPKRGIVVGELGLRDLTRELLPILQKAAAEANRGHGRQA